MKKPKPKPKPNAKQSKPIVSTIDASAALLRQFDFDTVPHLIDRLLDNRSPRVAEVVGKAAERTAGDKSI